MSAAIPRERALVPIWDQDWMETPDRCFFCLRETHYVNLCFEAPPCAGRCYSTAWKWFWLAEKGEGPWTRPGKREEE